MNNEFYAVCERDRDLNASINILNTGLKMIEATAAMSGTSLKKSKLVEFFRTSRFSRVELWSKKNYYDSLWICDSLGWLDKYLKIKTFERE